MPETKTAKKQNNAKQTEKSLEKLTQAATGNKAILIDNQSAQAQDLGQSLKKAGYQVSPYKKELPSLDQLRASNSKLAVVSSDLLIESLVGKMTHSLIDAIEPRNKFLDRYFEIAAELFHVPVCGIALLSTSRPWATFSVNSDISHESLDKLVDELSSGLMLANNLSIDLRGEPSQKGGKQLSHQHIIHIKQEKTPVGALVFASDDKEAFDPITKSAMDHMAERMLPLMRLVLANQELEILYQREQYRSSTDPLTGLYNLEFLVGFLQQQLLFSYRQRSPVGLVMIDIDHLKAINDEYGYEMGDLVLSSIGNRLLGMTRSSDLIARYGGGSFAIVMPNTDVNGSRVVAEKTRLEIQQMTFARGPNRQGPHVTVSIGCACFNMEDLNPETILRDSKIALQRAKQHGGNKVEV
jgi:diguanylate cyclase (GGDEF)-like protein